MLLEECRRWLLCFAISLPSFSCWSDEYSASATIVGGDIQQAKQTAIREVLRDVGLTGDVEVRSATSMINDNIVQASLVSSRLRITDLSVVEEKVVGKTLNVTIRVQTQRLQSAVCEPPIWINNVELVLQVSRNSMISGATWDGVNLFFSALRDALTGAYPGIVAPNAGIANRPYQLVGTIEREDTTNKPVHALAFKLQGGDGAIIKQWRYTLDVSNIATKKRQSLGYADLERLVLTPDSLMQTTRIGDDLSAVLRCMPVVARIPDSVLDGKIRIKTINGMKSAAPTLVFFSDRFPVKEDGLVDLLVIGGTLEANKIGENDIYVDIPKKIAGQPFPSPGAYLLLQ